MFNKMQEKKFLTVKEVAGVLRVSERSVMRYIKAKRLRAAKIGQWRIKAGDLRRFVMKNSNK
jgi:excisionase family DNA binding protein